MMVITSFMWYCLVELVKLTIKTKGEKTMKNLTSYILITGFLFSVIATNAQTVNIELEIPDGVVEAGDGIELRKSSDGTTFTTASVLEELGNGMWQGNFNPGTEAFEYKYAIIRANGEEEYEGWWNRKFDPVHSGTNISDVLRFLGGEKLQKRTELEIVLTLTGLSLNGEEPEQVGVMGSYGDLSWDLPNGVTLLEESQNDTWSAIVSFPAGTQVDFPIKFVWQHQGVWYWEQLPGYVDHLLILDNSGKNHKAEFAYNTQTRRVEAVAGQGVLINEYQTAAQRYGGTRNYEYYHAMQLVDWGDYTGAQSAYDSFRLHFREPYNDDFHGYLTDKLSMNTQLDQALAIAESWYAKEYEPSRKAYYKYLKGRLYLNNGRNAESRGEMEEVLKLSPTYDQEALRGYALYGIGYSYLQEEDTALVKKAEGPLRELIKDHPNEQMRRSGWEQLARLGERKRDSKLVAQAMTNLQEIGTSKQKLESRIRWVERRAQNRDLINDSTLVHDMQWLEWSVTDPETLDRVKLVKADYFLNKGKKNKALEVLFEVEGNGKKGTEPEQARQRLEGMDKDWKAKQQAFELRKANQNAATRQDSTKGGN